MRISRVVEICGVLLSVGDTKREGDTKQDGTLVQCCIYMYYTILYIYVLHNTASRIDSQLTILG